MMALLKSMLNKLTGLRISNNSGNAVAGDCRKRNRTYDEGEVDWDALPHTSKDNYGRKIYNALDYYQKRREGVVGIYKAPPPLMDQQDLDEIEEEKYKLWTMSHSDANNNWRMNIVIPTVEIVRSQLPRELHVFVSTNCKKDCRVWLWKNVAGQKARKQILQLQDQKMNKIKGYSSESRGKSYFPFFRTNNDSGDDELLIANQS